MSGGYNTAVHHVRNGSKAHISAGRMTTHLKEQFLFARGVLTMNTASVSGRHHFADWRIRALWQLHGTLLKSLVTPTGLEPVFSP